MELSAGNIYAKIYQKIYSNSLLRVVLNLTKRSLKFTHEFSVSNNKFIIKNIGQ